MLLGMKQIRGSRIEGSDGSLGSVVDFYLDGSTWNVRYLVVDTGKWLPGRRVLIAPAAIESIGDADGSVAVGMTKQGIENSPSVREHLPVSLRREHARNVALNWPYVMLSPAGVPHLTLPPEDDRARPDDEPHLRSLNELTGYGIEARDGAIGHADDLVVDPEDWRIRFVVIDTRNWLPGRKVLIDPDWVEGISWEDRRMIVGLTQSEIESSPEYDADSPIDRGYVERLYDFYGRSRKWNIRTPI